VLGAVFVAVMAGAGPADVDVYVTCEGAAPAYRAETIASAIFRRAGVTVVWHAWYGRGTVSAMALRVNLAERTPGDRLPGALGVCYPYADRSRSITVFCDRIRRSANRNPALESALLAHVLVHEITHVITGVDRHSASGMMKAHWDAADHDAMVEAPLPFSEVDLILIHQRLNKAQAANR